MIATGVLAAGLTAHALVANVSKRKELKERYTRGKMNEKNIDKNEEN